MKQTARTILFAAALLTLMGAQRAGAQDKVFAFGYAMSFPGTEMKKFIDEPSYLGGEIAFRFAPFYQTPFLIGVTLGWEVFSAESRDPVEFDGGTVSGLQRRTLNAFPILFTGHWYFGGNDGLRVFAGGAVGPTYYIQRFGIGVFEFEDGEWHFTVAPEVGVQYPVGGADLYVSARYNYSLEAGESVVLNESPRWDYTTLGIGFSWSGW